MTLRITLSGMVVFGLIAAAAGAYEHSAASPRELAEYHAGTGNRTAALLWYDKALAAQPDDALVYQSRGFFFLRQKDFDRALQDFSRQIRITPGDPVGYLNRGMLLEDMGRGDAAAADFRTACDLGSGDGCRMGGIAPAPGPRLR